VNGYLAPDGSYTAEYPPMWRRAAAAALDWLLAYVIFLVASIFAGVFQAIGWSAWTAGDLRGVPGGSLLVLSQLLVAAPVIAYFTLYWRTGSTLGMRALDIELVEGQLGRPPGLLRSLLRACLAFVFAVAANNVYTVLASDPLDGYSGFQRSLVIASFTVAGICAAGKLLALVHERRQSLWDKLFGLVYVEELVFTRTARWPWTFSERAESRAERRSPPV
jgi:RDD family